MADEASKTMPKIANVLFCLGLLLCCLAVYSIASWATPYSGTGSPKGNRLLIQESSSFELGDIWENVQSHFEIPIENRSDAQIDILGFSTSCNCLSIEPSKLLLTARQTASITLLVDSLDHGDAKQSASSSGAFEVFVAPITSSGPPGKVSWKIHGTIKKAILLRPGTVVFDGRIIAGQAHKPQFVSIKCVNPSIRGLELIADSSVVDANLIRKSDTDFQLVITPNRKLPIGAFGTALLLTARNDKDELLSRVKVPINGVVQHDIQCEPPRVQFGACLLGETVTETVVLESINGRAFVVERVDGQSDEVSIKPASKSSSETLTYTIAVRITRAGNQIRTTTFRIRFNDGETTSVSLDVHYFGLGS